MSISKIQKFTILLMFAYVLISGCVTGIDTNKDGKVDDVTVDVSPEKWMGPIYIQDLDNDEYPDEEDDFPNDDRYHLDTDHDGYADKVDAFPTDSKYHSDRDNDGYADEVDDFPIDSRYHSDFDQDGYADEVDEFKSNPRYHAVCAACDGTGIAYKNQIGYVDYTDKASWINNGIFNPDYYGHVTVANADSHEGVFEIKAYFEDNGVNMWEEKQKSYISKGSSHTFTFHYDANEDMDSFRWIVYPPTYTEKIESSCTMCQGAGKV